MSLAFRTVFIAPLLPFRGICKLAQPALYCQDERRQREGKKGARPLRAAVKPAGCKEIRARQHLLRDQQQAQAPAADQGGTAYRSRPEPLDKHLHNMHSWYGHSAAM